MQSILIVDDLDTIHDMLDTVVQPLGYQTAFASNGRQALQMYQEKAYDIVLTDISMEPMDGLELLVRLRETDPKAIVIMMSGYADIDKAMRSLRGGAYDFLTKPFKVDQLIKAINRAAAKSREVKSGASQGGSESDLIGESQVARKLRQAIDKLAGTNTPILLQGEIGTQRSLIAHILHDKSEARDEAFVTVDCAAAEAEELKARLIGSDGQGGSALKDARGGTLFIKDIDKLPIELQPRLGEIISETKGDLRFICSSCLNLESRVDSGKFDDSLFYRISTVPVSVPSLRDRPEDVPSIAQAILRERKLDDIEISAEAKSLLQGYLWHGNVRELRETIETAAAVCEENRIDPDDLPEKISNVDSWPTLQDFMGEKSQEYMQRVLNACQGDVDRAAQVLKCDPSAFEAVKR